MPTFYGCQNFIWFFCPLERPWVLIVLGKEPSDRVFEFVDRAEHATRDVLTVVGARVQAELRGQSCLPLALMAPTRQGIAVTRTFGRSVETWQELREAISAYTTCAAEKLRADGLEVRHLSVFAHTNPHNGDPWYSGQRAAQIEPTADTLALIGEAIRLLRTIWRPGFRYSKAGVMFTDLGPAARQNALFLTRDPVCSAKTMAALDTINARFGRGTVRPASTGIIQPWGRDSKIFRRATRPASAKS